jgi:hypothetical protein
VTVAALPATHSVDTLLTLTDLIKEVSHENRWHRSGSKKVAGKEKKNSIPLPFSMVE